MVFTERLWRGLVGPFETGSVEEAAPLLAAVANRGLVHDLFRQVAVAVPGKTALATGRLSITYAELDAWSDRIAVNLYDLGVERGDRIATLTLQGPESIALFLGILKAGAAYVPLDVKLSKAQIESVVETAGPVLLAVQETAGDALPALSSWHGQRYAIPSHLPGSAPSTAGLPKLDDPETLAYVMFTSGSTGLPKGVMIPHRGIVRLVRGANFATIDDRQVFLQMSPLAFDASTLEIWGALLNGGTLAFVDSPSMSVDDIGDAVCRHGVSIVFITSGLFNLIVDEAIDILKPIAQVMTGGDVLSPRHAELARKSLLSSRLINGYGPTENTTFTACYQIPRDRPVTGSVPIGYALNDTDVHILDPDLRPVPQGEVGELVVGGQGVALGYIGAPDLNAAKFIPDPSDPAGKALLYRTGDLARQEPDGLIEFFGRVDRQVKISGKRIELDEVERVMSESPLVRQAAAFIREIRPGDKQLAAAVVPCQPAPSVGEMLADLRTRLSGEACPVEIRLLDALPLSKTGKIDRRALEDLLKNTHAGPAVALPRTTAEKDLAKIWRDVLALDGIGIDDRFLDVGGTSLLLVRVHERVRRVWPDTKISDLFAHATIRELAAHLGRDASGPGTGRANEVQGRAEGRAAALRRLKDRHKTTSAATGERRDEHAER